jgi:Insertion element 4 transposase N-terminal
MSRTKGVLGAGVRLSDHLSASLLARVYRPALIQEILREHGVESKRRRSLPLRSARIATPNGGCAKRSCRS